MPVKDSNIKTINHVFHDDMVDALKQKENDLHFDQRLSEFGPDVPVKLFITHGSISIEFPTLTRHIKDEIEVEADLNKNSISLDGRISITIDYFGDKLRIFHNTVDTLGNDENYDQQFEILVVPSVKKLIEENGKNSD